MAKAEKRRRWRKKQTGFGAAVGFLREYEQKKTGTARGSVTVNHDAVGSSRAGVTGMTTDAKLSVCSVGDFLRKRYECLLTLFQR